MEPLAQHLEGQSLDDQHLEWSRGVLALDLSFVQLPDPGHALDSDTLPPDDPAQLLERLAPAPERESLGLVDQHGSPLASLVQLEPLPPVDLGSHELRPFHLLLQLELAQGLGVNRKIGLGGQTVGIVKQHSANPIHESVSPLHLQIVHVGARPLLYPSRRTSHLGFPILPKPECITTCTRFTQHRMFKTMLAQSKRHPRSQLLKPSTISSRPPISQIPLPLQHLVPEHLEIPFIQPVDERWKDRNSVPQHISQRTEQIVKFQ